jgi:general secretion pathway protein M
MSAPGSTDTSGGLAAARASLRVAWQDLARRWAALSRRDRRLLALGGLVLGAFLLWSLAIAPAWRSLRSAPAQIEALERALQQMQAQAAEAGALRAVAPVPTDQAQAALTAATERLGPPAKLSLQGERAVLSLKGASRPQLVAWLAEARAGARARVVEASLTQTGPGVYDGSLTLALGAGR